MIDETRGDDAFAESIAKPLRTPEHADATFETRVMSAVLAAARSEERAPRSWWTRPRTVTLSPIAALAWAAGLILLVGGTLMLSKARPQTSVAVSTDTVHVVRFVFLDSTARRVVLVGEFNQWQKGATVLTPGAPGVWTVNVPLTRGRHEYAFIVTDERGEHWVADPLSRPVRDDFGTESSVIAVGASST